MKADSLIRPVVRLASALAPGLVGRAVFWQCCRTPAPVKPEAGGLVGRAEQRLAAAQRQTVAYRTGAVETYSFAPDLSTPSRGTIALVHGWTGRAAFMTTFVAPLLEQGFRVVAVDLPGHGRSSGRLLHLPLGVEALHAVHAATGPWHGIVSHSFGGLISLALTSGRVGRFDGRHFEAVPVARQALIAVPQDAVFVFDFLGRTVGLGARAQAAMNAKVIALTGQRIEAFDGCDMIRASGSRTLVLHAPDDREVPFSCGQALAAAEDLVTLTPVPGAGHRRILYSPAAIELVAAFMAAPGRIKDIARDATAASDEALDAATASRE